MSYTIEQMNEFVARLDLRINMSPEAAETFSDQIVDEMKYQLAWTVIQDFVRTYPDWAEFGQGVVTVEQVVQFLTSALNSPIGTEGAEIVLSAQFDDREDLVNSFLIKGLELLFADKAGTDEIYHLNIETLGTASSRVNVTQSMLAEQHVRRILQSNQVLRARFAPDSSVQDATLGWLYDLTQQALQHPAVQMVIAAGDSGAAHSVLRLLPAGEAEVVGAQAQALVLSEDDFGALTQALDQNPRVGLGLLLTLLNSDSQQAVVQNVVRLWAGASTEAGKELDELFLKDDTAG